VTQQPPKVERIERNGLREALNISRLQADVAVSITGSLSNIVDAPPDRLLVVAEIVRHWCQLSPVAQTPYRATTGGTSPVAQFAWDYMDGISDASDGDEPGDGEAAKGGGALQIRRRWEAHVARLREGQHPRLPRQRVLVGEGDFGVTRPATAAERQAHDLDENGTVFELWVDGKPEVYWAGEIVFEQRPEPERQPPILKLPPGCTCR
jgi:hypothetical protein